MHFELLNFGRFRRRLVWANLLMAGSAAGWVVVTMSAMALPLDWALVALAFLLALAFYTRDRLDEKERQTDLRTVPRRTAWIYRHGARLKWLVWGSFLGAVILVAMRPAALLPLLAGLGFASSYTLRWLPWRGRRLGWKHLPGLKMPFVAALWTLTTVITPAAVYGRVWSPGQAGAADTWLLAGAVCLLIMVQILLNDLRDIEGDRLNGTLSWPVICGEITARRLGYALSLLSVPLAMPIAPAPFLLTAGYTIFLTRRYQRRNDSQWRAWIEAQGLVAALATLFALLFHNLVGVS